MSINSNLIKETWINLSTSSPINNVPPLVAFSATFYNTLFQEHPEYKKKFFSETDMAEQGKKLVKILGVAVKSCDRIEELIDPLSKLGERHAMYGVLEEDEYMHVGQSLLFALETHLGEFWTKEVEEAWTNTYVALSKVMIEATKKYLEKNK